MKNLIKISSYTPDHLIVHIISFYLISSDWATTVAFNLAGAPIVLNLFGLIAS